MKIGEEEDLRRQWKIENVRRRHNYLPFIVELLKSLASKEQLLPVYQVIIGLKRSIKKPNIPLLKSTIFQKAKEKAIELNKKKQEKKAAAAATDEN
jgi:hypothetical protein